MPQLIMGSLDDSNDAVSHGNIIENASTKLSSLNELQQQQNAHPNPNHYRRPRGLLAFLPKTGRHYVFDREAWIAAEKERRQCSGTTSQHRRSKKQQRRFERRQQLTQSSSSDAAALCTTTTADNSNTTTGTRICDCLPYEEEDIEMGTSTGTTNASSSTATAPGGTANRCLTNNVVICLALLDPQHQPLSRQVLSRLVPLCAETDLEPETRPSMDDKDKAPTSARIHGWVLLQSAASSQYIDYWFAHSGLTVLVCDDSNDVPKEPTATESSENTVTPCAVVDPATTAATAANKVATVETCAQLLLSPAPLSPWLWTALGMHHCPAVTILDGRTGRRCQTQQERLLLDANKSDAAIRKAWLRGPCSNDGLSLSLISTCTVQ
jgi:hypothetical protein